MTYYQASVNSQQSISQASSFTNPKAFLIIGVMVALQVVLTYVPFMQKAFHTANLSLTGWGDRTAFRGRYFASHGTGQMVPE